MTDVIGRLACRCGACRITLCDPTMRARIECLCCDCRQRGLISASRHPDNALPDAVRDYERGVDLVYFANALDVDDASRELLLFSKLTEDAYNTTAMSACCGTLMCGTHPMYEGNTISVNADSCRVTTPSTLAVQGVTFAADAPTDRVAAIADRSPVPVLFSVYDEMDHPVMQAFVKAATAPVLEAARARATTSFEDLCAGRPIEIDGSFFEESRAGKP